MNEANVCACIGPAGDCPCIRRSKGLTAGISESYTRLPPAPERTMTDRELLVMCFERILGDWRQIDAEWGPTEGGLAGAIERSEETLIPLLRKHLGAAAALSELVAEHFGAEGK